LTERFRKLDKEKTRVQTLLGSASEQLEQLLSEAEEKFGTRELSELKSKLKGLEKENFDMKKQYQKQLTAIEEKLDALESDLPEDQQED
jgi:predicted  nucleic acid-binding Zn-ribbon protein